MGEVNIAVLGAGGMVGQKVLEILEERHFPAKSLRLLATARSAGSKVSFRGENLTIEEVDAASFKGVEVAFFCASSEAARELAPQAVRDGAVVIDKSNAFRMDPRVPLAVPEVNPQAIREHDGIIASPNCSTIQLVVALYPLHQLATLRRVLVSTYQSVSGSGREAVEELRTQTVQVLAGEEPAPQAYPYRIAFNLLPHIDSFEENGYTREEMKLVRETRKILREPELAIAATAVRVPVFYAHSESVVIETERSLSSEEARRILENAPGVRVVDDPAALRYPMPEEATGRDEVLVGRIRQDLSAPRGLALWVVADNLRKGAATNAVQIAELLNE
ncbi:MAG: aspartate-semialdehyde dehydrogenase [Thermaerobacter sp.]|nr:aspartate-semialdehyde dehydrogenase [Thermaerobacter sp.]